MTLDHNFNRKQKRKDPIYFGEGWKGGWKGGRVGGGMGGRVGGRVGGWQFSGSIC